MTLQIIRREEHTELWRWTENRDHSSSCMQACEKATVPVLIHPVKKIWLIKSKRREKKGTCQEPAMEPLGCSGRTRDREKHDTTTRRGKAILCKSRVLIVTTKDASVYVIRIDIPAFVDRAQGDREGIVAWANSEILPGAWCPRIVASNAYIAPEKKEREREREGKEQKNATQPPSHILPERCLNTIMLTVVFKVHVNMRWPAPNRAKLALVLRQIQFLHAMWARASLHRFRPVARHKSHAFPPICEDEEA